MTLDEVMAALEAAGSESVRAIYGRHGVQPPLFGVRIGDLERLRKQLGRRGDLAAPLWATGNHDARSLACRLADPHELSAEVLQAWAAEVRDAPLADALAALVARSPHRARLAEAWRGSPEEYPARLGWRLVAQRVMSEPDLPAAVLDAWLGEIAARLPEAHNRARQAMHDALIAIGGSRGDVRARALAVADALGPVVIDHGETACETPNARVYIEKMAARAAARGSA